MRGSDPDVGHGAQGRGSPVPHRRARALVAALALASSVSWAQAAPPAEAEELPTGALFQVGLAETASLTPATPMQSGTAPQLASVPLATVRAGVWLARHHEISIGLGFMYLTSTTSSSFGASSSLIDVVAMPTYRYHFNPLKPWALSPFVEVAGLIGILDLSNGPQGPGNSSTTTVELGAHAGIGGEYLIGDRFGLVVSGGVRYLNYNIPASAGFGVSTTVNAVQLWGQAAAALHF